MGYTKIEYNTKYLNEKAIKEITEYLDETNLKYDIEINKIIITLPYAFFEDDQFCFDLGVTLTLIRINSNSNSERLEFISLCLNALKSKQ